MTNNDNMCISFSALGFVDRVNPTRSGTGEG